MHNKVVYNAMKSLSKFGFHVLRFNFRGAGLSEGKHDEGRGEVNDVRAALDYLHQEYKLPLIFAGFSFGAATGLRNTHGVPIRLNAGVGRPASTALAAPSACASSS